MRTEQEKGTLSSAGFDDLEQRIEIALHAPKGDGTATHTTVDDRNDEDTEIEALMISDEDTAVDHELLNNDATTPIDVFADTDSEQSTAISMATDIINQGPIKTEGDILNDRYEITEFIGSGGMSRVYKAVDRHKVEAGDTNPFVAVKILNRKYNFLENLPYMLQREAENCQSLVHLNIVEVFDFGHDGATVFMIMEYLSGESLRTKINAHGFQGMPIQEAQLIITAAAHALSFAHDHGVVHRDFKPGNVIVTDDGEIKVIDFGIAQAFQNVNEPDSDTQIRGAITPIYASPEMLEHEDPDPRDDVFSLACTAYQLITGQHPFKRMPVTEARDIGTRLKRSKKLSGLQWRALRNALNFERDQRTDSISAFVNSFTANSVPWKPAVAIAAGFFAFAVAGFLVHTLTVINGIEDVNQTQVALNSSVQKERMRGQQSAQQQLVSETSKTTAEPQRDVAPSTSARSVVQPQSLESSPSIERMDTRSPPQDQLIAERTHLPRLEPSLSSNSGLIDGNLEQVPAEQNVSKPQLLDEGLPAIATAEPDPEPVPQPAHEQPAGLTQNLGDIESTSKSPSSGTQSAAVEPVEEKDQGVDITEFSAIASVAQPALSGNEMYTRIQLAEQEPNNSVDVTPGDHQDTPGTSTQTLLVHDEQALFNSAKHGDLQTIDAIIKSGFPLNSREQSSGATAIIMASRHGHTDVVRALLNAGADVQTQDNKDMTALLWATQGGHFEVVHALSDHGIDTEVRNSAGETALLAAAWDGYQDIVSSLLANGADVNARNNEGWSALINASINGHVSVVHTLLDSGADPSLPAFDGKTALMAAAWNGHTDIVRVLSKNESTVNMRNADGWTALMNAAWNGHRAAVKILVDTGAEVQSVNVDNHTAAALATSRGHRDIAALLQRVR